MIDLERKLKELENILGNDESLILCKEVKIELDSIYNHNAEGIRIRSKCDRHEHVGKCGKVLFKLGKKFRT